MLSLLLLGFPAPAPQLPGAWVTEDTFFPPTAQEVGGSIIAGPDMDQDGHQDIVFGRNPSWSILSSKDHTVLRNYPNPTGLLMNSPALTPDQDGDGLEDILCIFNSSGFGGIRKTALVSTGTGQPLFQYDFQGSISSPLAMGDLDGDGILDFALCQSEASLPGQSNLGALRLYSGATGQILHEVYGENPSEGFACQAVPLGDLNGDGVTEIVTAASRATRNGFSFAGVIYVYSGADLTLLYARDGEWREQNLGKYFSTLEDVDGDGQKEILVSISTRHQQNARKIGVLSGASGDLLYEVAPHYLGNNQFGAEVLTDVGDLSHDGFHDFAVSRRLVSHSSVTGLRFYSGFDGQLLGQYLPPNQAQCLLPLGDTNGNQQDEFCVLDIFMERPSGPFQPHGALIFSAFHPTLQIDQADLPASIGGTLRFDVEFPETYAGSRYRILGSASGMGTFTFQGIPIPLTPDPLFRRMLAIPWQPLAQGFSGLLDSHGLAHATQVVPPFLLSAWSGSTFYFACVILNGQNQPILSSTAVSLLILP